MNEEFQIIIDLEECLKAIRVLNKTELFDGEEDDLKDMFYTLSRGTYPEFVDIYTKRIEEALNANKIQQ